jgi:tetratricopeptide (TPR) repeat protein
MIMRSRFYLPLCLALFSAVATYGQSAHPSPSPQNTSESSSRDNLDLSPLPDTKEHKSESASTNDDIEEAHSFDPHRAAKDVEVGEFYYKRKNYQGAIERYREALTFKENDAEATFGLARCEEKLGQFDEARTHYEAYLKILPHGPRAADSKKALEHLASKKQPVVQPASTPLAYP